jgi:hypothetical protein
MLSLPVPAACCFVRHGLKPTCASSWAIQCAWRGVVAAGFRVKALAPRQAIRQCRVAAGAGTPVHSGRPRMHGLRSRTRHVFVLVHACSMRNDVYLSISPARFARLSQTTVSFSCRGAYFSSTFQRTNSRPDLQHYFSGTFQRTDIVFLLQQISIS